MNNKIAFKTYIKQFKGQDNPYGDFADEALSPYQVVSRNFPRSIKSWPELSYFLLARGCYGTPHNFQKELETAHELWHKYKVEIKKDLTIENFEEE